MSQNPKPLGIVIATRWEAGGILRRFHFERQESDLYRGEINRHPALLCISGVGMEAARTAAHKLCDRGVSSLISTGFCGALVPELQLGDLVTDRIVTSRLAVRTRDEREALAKKANALAVDMETQAVIEAGTRRGVPIRVLRVVSDGMDDDLTPLFGPVGQFSRWKIALRLLNPQVWPLANKLRRHSQVAKARLADAFAQMP